MAPDNRMRLGRYEFAVEVATFHRITASWSGPGWDFSFSGPCLNDGPDENHFPYGARLLAEAAPLPLPDRDDLTGVELVLPLSFDEKSGEAYFGINVHEEHEVSDVRLRFAERDGPRYRIEFTGVVAETVFGRPEALTLNGWAEHLPDHAYPT